MYRRNIAALHQILNLGRSAMFSWIVIHWFLFGSNVPAKYSTFFSLAQYLKVKISIWYFPTSVSTALLLPNSPQYFFTHLIFSLNIFFSFPPSYLPLFSFHFFLSPPPFHFDILLHVGRYRLIYAYVHLCRLLHAYFVTCLC